MGTLPALIPFQVPQVNLGDTFTAMARLSAYDQARRASLLEQEEKRGKLDRDALWRQTIAGAFPTQETGFAAAPPAAATRTVQAPMPTQGGVPQGGPMPMGTTGQPGGFTMAQQVPPATPEQGSYARLAPGGMPPTSPMSYGNAPMDLQSRVALEGMAGTGPSGGFTGAQPGMPAAITAMAPPVDTTQPPLQGGGFTQALAGTAPQPTGFTAPQPTRPLSASVPGLMPLPNAEAVQQAFAIDPEKTSQWYGAYVTQRGKQLETVDRNNKLVYQVTGAMLENPEYYQEGLDYLREQGVPVPKNMPTTYNAALVNFHHTMAQERMSPLDAEKVKTQQLMNQLIPQAMQQMQAPGGGETGPAPGAGEARPAGSGAAAAPSGQPVIDTALAENARLYNVRLPLLQSIAKHESNYNSEAVSPTGATGVMQLMPGTARDMGVDNPKDPAQNIRGGTRYYAQLLTKYGGDEAKALAAYNWGPGNVDKVGGDLTKMPAETQAYVKNVLGTAASGTRGPADTRMQVAGPEAPAPSPASATPEVRRLDQQMAESQQKIKIFQALALANPQQFGAVLASEQKTFDDLRAERTLLTEPQRAGARVRAEEQERYQQKTQQQAGPMLPEARRELFTKLRTDIRQEPTFQTYQAVRNGYQNVQIGADGNNAIGDLAIVNGIAKIFDPSSAVMRGEAATVEEAQGRLQVILNSPQRFFEGDRLTPQARQSILALAQTLARRKLTTAEKELRQVYEPFAKEGGFQFSQLLPLEDIPAATSGNPAQAGTPAPAASPPAPRPDITGPVKQVSP